MTMLSALTGRLSSATHVFHRHQEQRHSPIVLKEPTRFPYGPFKFKSQVTKDLPYIIHASTDLRNWIPLTTGVAKTELIEFVDSEAPKFGCRFYRMTAGESVSVNIIGFASRTLVPGFCMIANPLRTASQTISQLFHGWPDGTRVSRFDIATMKLAENVVKNGAWVNPNDRLLPGEGALFFNPTNDYKGFSFVGEVNLHNLSLPIPAGFSIRSSMVPQPGALTDDLKFPISNGDVVHLFDPDKQEYALYPFENGKWTSGQPVVGICESFWIAKDKPGNWILHLISA